MGKAGREKYERKFTLKTFEQTLNRTFTILLKK
jgi:hypothetical protein